MSNVDTIVINIFEKTFDIPAAFWTNETKDTPLLGNTVGLFPTELLYIFSNIEVTFDITIPDEEIVNYGFTSFNNITAMLNRVCKSYPVV